MEKICLLFKMENIFLFDGKINKRNAKAKKSLMRERERENILPYRYQTKKPKLSNINECY